MRWNKYFATATDISITQMFVSVSVGVGSAARIVFCRKSFSSDRNSCFFMEINALRDVNILESA